MKPTLTQTASAYQKNLRTSARKMRLVADLIRLQSVDKALIQLNLSPKRAAKSILKVLIQAQKNALNTRELDGHSLVVKEIIIEDGPIIKRWRAVSRGRAHSIMKRTSHVKITLSGTNRQVQADPKPSVDKKSTSKITNQPKTKKK